MSSNTPAKADDPTSSVPALPGDLGDLIPTMDDLGVSAGLLASMTPTFQMSGPSSTTFDVPELLHDQLGKSADEIVGVPITSIRQRVRWEPGSELGDAAPTCRSHDGKTGSGEYTDNVVRECATCPAAQFGADGTAPECNERAAVIVVIESTLDPVVVSVPVTSIAHVKRWAAGLTLKAGKGLPSWMTVLTRFTLDVRPLKSGKKVAQFVIENIGVAEGPLLNAARTDGYQAATSFRDSGEHVADSAGAESVADSGPQEV